MELRARRKLSAQYLMSILDAIKTVFQLFEVEFFWRYDVVMRAIKGIKKEQGPSQARGAIVPS